MKRKGPDATGDAGPTKVVKVTSDDKPDASAASPARGSGRQKKPPAWMASYVIAGKKEELAEEPAKPKKSEVKKADKKAEVKKGVKKADVKKADDKSEVKKTDKNAEVKKVDKKAEVKKADKKVEAKKADKKAEVKKADVKKSDKKATKKSETQSSSGSDNGKGKKSEEKKLTAKKKQQNSTIASSNTLTNMLTSSVPTAKTISDIISSLSEPEDASADSATEESSMLEICNVPNGISHSYSSNNVPLRPVPSETEKPSMFEVVFCISTSGAMKDYLTDLQDRVRETVWRLQSIIPNLRIGVIAHTQGGIHDDKPEGNRSPVAEHSYIRTGGHSGTKYLDLGATMSQICAFVDSLESEATVYPDYVQDNLEMALWKLQRCMTWSSCSYRTVIMMGRGRPNRTSFYTQREHWRGWIRSALQLGKKEDIPVIDWELEARKLGEMDIHVFTIQATSPKSSTQDVGEEDKEEDEGNVFFHRVPELTKATHIAVAEPTSLMDIIIGICAACQGPDLLQEHRDQVRDENDGVLPQQLVPVFVSLQLHSKSKSMEVMPQVKLVPQVKEVKASPATALFTSSSVSAKTASAKVGDCSESESEQKSEEVVFTSLKSESDKKSKTDKKKVVGGAKDKIDKVDNSNKKDATNKKPKAIKSEKPTAVKSEKPKPVKNEKPKSVKNEKPKAVKNVKLNGVANGKVEKSVTKIAKKNKPEVKKALLNSVKKAKNTLTSIKKAGTANDKKKSLPQKEDSLKKSKASKAPAKAVSVKKSAESNNKSKVVAKPNSKEGKKTAVNGNAKKGGKSVDTKKKSAEPASGTKRSIKPSAKAKDNKASGKNLKAKQKLPIKAAALKAGLVPR